MSAELEWLGLAEGAGEDSKGAVTLIGVNQNVVIARELPISAKRVLAMIIRDRDHELENAQWAVEVRVETPSGKVILANTQGVQLGPSKYPELPATMVMVAELQVTIDEIGTYRAICTLTPTGPNESDFTVTGVKELYVVDASSSSSEDRAKAADPARGGAPVP